MATGKVHMTALEIMECEEYVARECKGGDVKGARRDFVTNVKATLA